MIIKYQLSTIIIIINHHYGCQPLADHNGNHKLLTMVSDQSRSVPVTAQIQLQKRSSKLLWHGVAGVIGVAVSVYVLSQ